MHSPIDEDALLGNLHDAKERGRRARHKARGDRRSAPRFLVALPVTVEIETPRRRWKESGETVNVSESGVQIVFPDEGSEWRVHDGDRLHLTCFTPDGRILFHAPCVVAWVQGKRCTTRCGAAFVRMNRESRAAIQAFFQTLEQENSKNAREEGGML